MNSDPYSSSDADDIIFFRILELVRKPQLLSLLLHGLLPI